MEMSNGDTLVLFTLKYPFDKTEPFLEDELNVLHSKFRKVILVPFYHENQAKQRPVPENVNVAVSLANKQPNKKRILQKNWPYFFAILLQEIAKRPGLLFSKPRETIGSLFVYFQQAERVEALLDTLSGKQVVLYTYWLDQWPNVLGILKRKKRIAHYVSRAHGFDLYHYRREDGVIPLRNFQLATVDHIFLISQNGYDYLSHHYPNRKNLLSVSRLGVKDRGTNPYEKDDVYSIVSICNLLPLKRVEAIIEVLRHTPLQVKWVNFGGGPQMDRLVKLANSLPDNISWELKGHVPHDEVMQHLQLHPVHLLIHLSQYEGLPVSLMEACSFGIPLMACDVGGVREIVQEETGVLLPAEVNTKNISEQVVAFLNGEKNQPAFRKQVRTFWEKNFDATKNYADFSEELSKWKNKL